MNEIDRQIAHLKAQGFYPTIATHANDLSCTLWNSYGVGTLKQYLPSGRGQTAMDAIHAAIADRDKHKDRLGGYKP